MGQGVCIIDLIHATSRGKPATQGKRYEIAGKQGSRCEEKEARGCSRHPNQEMQGGVAHIAMIGPSADAKQHGAPRGNPEQGIQQRGERRSKECKSGSGCFFQPMGPEYDTENGWRAHWAVLPKVMVHRNGRFAGILRPPTYLRRLKQRILLTIWQKTPDNGQEATCKNDSQGKAC